MGTRARSKTLLPDLTQILGKAVDVGLNLLATLRYADFGAIQLIAHHIGNHADQRLHTVEVELAAFLEKRVFLGMPAEEFVFEPFACADQAAVTLLFVGFHLGINVLLKRGPRPGFATIERARR